LIAIIKRLLPIIFIFTLLCQVPSANAEEVSVAIFIEPPFADVVDNKFVGQNIEILKVLLIPLELTPVFVRCPFARCLTLVEQGKVDMIMGLKKLPEREKNLIFLEPPHMVQHYPLRFFTLTANKTIINKFEDLEKLTVGTLRGGRYFEQFDNDTAIAKVELNSRKQLVEMLLRGRIDTFIEREESVLPYLSLTEYLKQFSLANYQYTKDVNSYIAVSKHSAIKVYAERLTTQLNKLVDNGTMKTIRMKSYH